MAVGGDLLTSEQVSVLLGIGVRQVRALAEAGSITRVARGVFDRASVERFRAERGSGRTRTWAEHTSWGALALLSGTEPVGLGEVQRHRLRAALRSTIDSDDLAIRLRDRATITTWSGHRSIIDRVRKELVIPGRRALGLVADDSIVNGYIQSDRVAGLVQQYRLVEDARGAITLRGTAMPIDYVTQIASSGDTLAAVDAATSLDPRERGAGTRALNKRLELFRAHADD